MAKKKHVVIEPIKGGELLGLRVQLVGHIVWPNEFGTVEVQYVDGSVRVRADRKFQTKATGTEYEVCLFDQVNQPK